MFHFSTRILRRVRPSPPLSSLYIAPTTPDLHMPPASHLRTTAHAFATTSAYYCPSRSPLALAPASASIHEKNKSKYKNKNKDRISTKYPSSLTLGRALLRRPEGRPPPPPSATSRTQTQQLTRRIQALDEAQARDPDDVNALLLETSAVLPKHQVDVLAAIYGPVCRFSYPPTSMGYPPGRTPSYRLHPRSSRVIQTLNDVYSFVIPLVVARFNFPVAFLGGSPGRISPHDGVTACPPGASRLILRRPARGSGVEGFFPAYSRPRVVTLYAS